MTGVKTNKIVSVVLLTLGVLWFVPAWIGLNVYLFFGAGWYQKYPLQYEVPPGYVGWVQVRFNRKSAERLKTSGPYAVVPIDDSGVVITSSPMPTVQEVPTRTGKEDRYLYQHNKAPLPAERVHFFHEDTDTNTHEFFIGSIAQYYEYKGDKAVVKQVEDSDISFIVPGKLAKPVR